MSGPMTRAVYTDDAGVARSVRLPTWEYGVTNAAGTILQTGATVATTEPGLPKGYRRRKRYYIVTATGKEGSVTVLDPTSSLWTAADGSPIEIPLFGSALPVANNATLRGTTGERHKA